MFVCFVPSLSSCHEKAKVAIYFGWIRTCLGVVDFRVFRLFLWLLTTKFTACSKPPSRDNYRKAPNSRTQQRVRWEWDLNLDHALNLEPRPWSHVRRIKTLKPSWTLSATLPISESTTMSFIPCQYSSDYRHEHERRKYYAAYPCRTS